MTATMTATMTQARSHLRLLLKVTGWALVGVGIVGLLLPLMPGTPFLLLGAFFVAASAD